MTCDPAALRRTGRNDKQGAPAPYAQTLCRLRPPASAAPTEGACRNSVPTAADRLEAHSPHLSPPRAAARRSRRITRRRRRAALADAAAVRRRRGHQGGLLLNRPRRQGGARGFDAGSCRARSSGFWRALWWCFTEPPRRLVKPRAGAASQCGWTNCRRGHRRPGHR